MMWHRKREGNIRLVRATIKIKQGDIFKSWGSQKPVICDNLEQWMGWEVGAVSRGRWHRYTYD